MTFHQSTFLAVCAPDTMMGSKFWGCGAELLIEQVRGIEGAREAAVANGWTWSRPSAWDEDRRDITLCPECTRIREQRIAARSGRTGAVDE